MDDSFGRARAAFLAGVQHFEAGRLDEAEASFLQSLDAMPQRASTRINLAATHLHQGRRETALGALEILLQAEPQHLDAWCLRALALAELGRTDESLVCADHVLAVEPDNPVGWQRRGDALERLRRFDEALAAFDRVAEMQPHNADAMFRASQLRHRLGRLGEAVQGFDSVLALAPTHAAASSQRGLVLKALGRTDEAAAAFERAIVLGADAPLHRFFLGALGRDGPANAPPQYVRSLFDDYADSFDRHLVEVLGYRAHQQLVAPLPTLQSQRFDSALELGCGTGLCAPPLRPLVRRLEGVDLSPAMLQRAEALGLYDKLVCADLVDHLRGCEAACHDLVLAADVFIYVGALESVFEAVRHVLRPGALFCFSVERSDDGTPLRLTPDLRYAHSLPYLLGLAAQYGLRPQLQLRQPIRQDQTQAIDGLYLYLRAD